MHEETYKSILTKAPFGLAYYRIIYDGRGNPVDYEFLEVNTAFENLTGLKASEIIGKTVCEVIPGIKESNFDLAAHYDDVAINGGEKEFEQFFEPLNKWYKVQASSPLKGYLTTIFTDISSQYKLAAVAQTFLTYTPDAINYQYIIDTACEIAGAKYAAFNIFEEKGHSFSTVAFSGMTPQVNMAIQKLGIQFPGQKWNYDPIRQEKTDNKKTTLFPYLSQLTSTVIEAKTVDALALKFNVNPVAEVKIEKRGRMLGYLTFIFTNGQQLQNQSVLETYADMTGMLLDRLNQERETNREFAKFKQITSQITDIIWQTDLQFNSIYISPSVESILGFGVDEYMKLPAENRYPLETLQMFQLILQEELEKENQPGVDKNRTYTIEIEHYKADNSIIPTEVHVSFVRDENGIPVGLQGVSHDITERKALEEDIEHQNKFRKILIEIASGFINIPLENMDMAIGSALKDLGKFVDADRSYTFDYDWEKDVCNNIYEWCADDITPEIENLQNVPLHMMRDWVDAHKKGESMYIPDVFQLPFGDVREILQPQGIKSLLAVPMSINGNCIGFVGFDSVKQPHNFSSADQQLLHVFAQVLANVKIRKEMIDNLVIAMRKIEDSEKKLKESQTIAKLGGWELDVKKEVFTFNDNFYTLFHTTASEMGGYEMTAQEYAERFLFAEDSHFVAEEMGKATSTNNPDFSNYLEHRIKYYDGGTGYIAVKYYIIKDRNGNTTITYGVNQDITERKFLELDLIAAKEKAEESSRLKTAFLNNISHEIRTPLNGILGFGGLMMDVGLSFDDKLEFYNLLQQSTNRLLQTITDIMDISEIKAGTIIPRITDIHTAYVMNSQIEKFRTSSTLKKNRLIVQIPIDYKNLIVQTDEELFNKILSQILSNAIKFTTGGSIILGFEVFDKWVRFFVKDTGKGIATDKLETIFEPFIQEDLSNTRGHEGNGLGLSLAKGMVELLGGKIWVESQKGFGSTFFFELPFEIERVRQELKIEEAPKTKINTDKQVVLIAEDDEMNYIYMKALLTRMDCIQLHAYNGAETVDLCRQHPEISLILMDNKMPVMNGIEATRLIREFRPELPIIASTAYAQTGDEQRFIEAGCNDYIAKPIKKDDLIKLLNKYLNRTQ